MRTSRDYIPSKFLGGVLASRGNPNWVKGGSSPNPAGRKRADTAAEKLQRTHRRLDDWTSAITGAGSAASDKRQSYSFQADIVPDNLAAELWRGDDLAARVVETTPNEIARAGYDLRISEAEGEGEKPEGKAPDKKPQEKRYDYLRRARRTDAGEKDLCELITTKWEELGVVEALRTVRCYENAYAGGAIMLGADDGTRDLRWPLDLDKVKSLDWMTVLERAELSPSWYYDNPREAKYGEVAVWRINPLGVGVGNPDKFAPPLLETEIHESRLIIFGGLRVSRLQRAGQDAGWGDSALTRFWRVLRDFNIGWSSAVTLLAEFAPAVLKIEGLAEIFGSDNDQVFSAKMRQVALAKSTLGTTIIDSKEEYARQSTPIQGLPEMMNILMVRLSAAARQPMTKLFGTSPGGLNATGESDTRNYYDEVAGERTRKEIPALERITEILFRVEGAEPQHWCVEGKPLWQPTEKEKAETRFLQAQSDEKYIINGVLSSEEVLVNRFAGDSPSYETYVDLDSRVMGEPVAESPAKTEQQLEDEQKEADAAAAQLEASIRNKPKPAAKKDDAPRIYRSVQRTDIWIKDKHGKFAGSSGGGGGGGGISPAREKSITEAKEFAEASERSRGQGIATQREASHEELVAVSQFTNPHFSPEQHAQHATEHLHETRVARQAEEIHLARPVDERAAEAGAAAEHRTRAEAENEVAMLDAGHVAAPPTEKFHAFEESRAATEASVEATRESLNAKQAAALSSLEHAHAHLNERERDAFDVDPDEVGAKFEQADQGLAGLTGGKARSYPASEVEPVTLTTRPGQKGRSADLEQYGASKRAAFNDAQTQFEALHGEQVAAHTELKAKALETTKAQRAAAKELEHTDPDSLVKVSGGDDDGNGAHPAHEQALSAAESMTAFQESHVDFVWSSDAASDAASGLRDSIKQTEKTLTALSEVTGRAPAITSIKKPKKSAKTDNDDPEDPPRGGRRADQFLKDKHGKFAGSTGGGSGGGGSMAVQVTPPHDPNTPAPVEKTTKRVPLAERPAQPALAEDRARPDSAHARAVSLADNLNKVNQPSAQRAVREDLLGPMQDRGFHVSDAGKSGEFAIVVKKGSAEHHEGLHWDDGRMELNQKLASDGRDFFSRAAKGESVTETQVDAAATLFHEALHGTGPGGGRWVDEVTTEVSARMIMREDYGVPMGPLGGSGRGGYGSDIDDGLRAVHETLHPDVPLARRHERLKGAEADARATAYDDASRRLESAAVNYKRRSTLVDGDHWQTFANSFEGFTPEQKATLRSKLSALGESMRG